MTTLNQALKVLATGDQAGAWRIAYGDPSLNKSVTREKWLDFAHKALDRRKADAPKSRIFEGGVQ